MHRLLVSILLLAVVLLESGCLGTRTGDDLARCRSADSIRIGVKESGRPFGYRIGGQFTGFDVDIAHNVAQRLGINEVVFVPVTSANRIDRLVDGEVDLVIASMTITRSRDARIDFSIPYFQDGQALLVPVASPIQSYLDLAGTRVGCLDGSTGAINMKQVAPSATVVTYPTSARMAEALAAGTVDAISNDYLYLMGVMQATPEQYRIAGSRFSTEPYGIGVRENQSELRDAVNEALQAMWEDGSWQLIFATWFGPGTRYETDIAFAISPYPH